jgi:thymidylate synthase
MVAQVCNLKVGDFIYTMGDMHVYHNHFDGVYEQLKREPLALPNLWLNPEIKNIFDFTMNDIKLLDYQSHGKIDFEMAV